MYEAFIGCAECSYGVMVSTLDFESSDPDSNPGRTSFCTATDSTTTILLLLHYVRHYTRIVEVSSAATSATVSQSSRVVAAIKPRHTTDGKLGRRSS